MDNEIRELINGMSHEKLNEAIFFLKYMQKMSKEESSKTYEMVLQKDFKVREYIQSLMVENAKLEGVTV